MTANPQSATTAANSSDDAVQSKAQQHRELGNAAYTAKNYQTAIDEYTRAIELDGSNHLLWSNRSAAHAALKDFEKSLGDAEECLKLNPTFPKAHKRKIEALVALHRGGDAERAWRQAESLDPKAGYLGDLWEEITREDGDLSPLKSRDGSDRQLRTMQAEIGCQLHPDGLPNDLFKAAYIGMMEAVQTSFSLQAAAERATKLRLPLLTIVVSGAQRMRSGPMQHVAVCRWLIERGVRVDARDTAGYTALMHATCHHCQLDLAEVLYEGGADVNVHNRFGQVPLHNAVQNQESEAVKWLLERGACIDAVDNDNFSVLQTAAPFARMLALLHNARLAAAQRGTPSTSSNADGSKASTSSGEGLFDQPLTSCAACGAANPPHSCKRCFATSYCSRECQEKHWSQHKDECRTIASQLLRVRVESAAFGQHMPSLGGYGSALPLSAMREYQMQVLSTGAADTSWEEVMARTRKASEKAGKKNNKKLGKRVKVKIQLTLEPLSEVDPMQGLQFVPKRGETMLCYDRSRNFQVIILPGSGDARRLEEIILSQGLGVEPGKGVKGYFFAWIDPKSPGELILQPSMLPAQDF